MILALICACQIVAARGQMVIRNGEAVDRVDLTVSGGTPYVTWSTLEQNLGARLRTLPSGRAMIEIAGVQFELAHGVPFTRVGDRVVPLSAAPRISGNDIAVPLSLVAQVLPRFAPGVRYDIRSRTFSMPLAAAVAVATDAAKPATKAPVAVAALPRRHRVVIDAGHGGPDEGTSVVTKNGTRITEKSITLSVATILGSELRLRDFDVVFTRSKDTLIALHDRGRLANASGGQAFVSVHVNSAGSARNATSARGVETYFLSVARTEDAKRVQALENSSARFEDPFSIPDKRDPLSYILGDMKQNDQLRESSEMAERIQQTLSKGHPGGNRGVKQAEFAVLVGSFMPAVLVEIGFLSNASEAAYLAKKENQRKIAVAIADAVAAYFKGYDRRVVANGDGK